MEQRDIEFRTPKGKRAKPVAKPSVRRKVRVPMTLGAKRSIPVDWITFNGLTDGKEHIALCVGDLSGPPLVRLHSECMTGDVFGSERCDCGAQLHEALGRIAESGGVLIYLRQEGRGIGLYNKLDAYALQDKGLDTFEANRMLDFPEDMRDYRCAAEILKALGITSVQLLSNNPDKAAQLAAHGIVIDRLVTTGAFVTPHNRRYLEAKVECHGHDIDLPSGVPGVD